MCGRPLVQPRKSLPHIFIIANSGGKNKNDVEFWKALSKIVESFLFFPCDSESPASGVSWRGEDAIIASAAEKGLMSHRRTHGPTWMLSQSRGRMAAQAAICRKGLV